jgi:hypothetical protein
LPGSPFPFGILILILNVYAVSVPGRA